MKKIWLFNHKGITLIELLASLAIFSMVIGLISTILIQSFHYEERTADRISLRQEANIVVTQLRQQHREVATYKICYGNNQMLYLGDIGNEMLSDSNMHFLEVTITNNNETLSQEGNCITIDTTDPTIVQFTLSSEGQQYTLETVINRIGKLEK